MLAGQLVETAGDHRGAFFRYEDVMRDYVEQCQKLARGSAIVLTLADLAAQPVVVDAVLRALEGPLRRSQQGG